MQLRSKETIECAGVSCGACVHIVSAYKSCSERESPSCRRFTTLEINAHAEYPEDVVWTAVAYLKEDSSGNAIRCADCLELFGE